MDVGLGSFRWVIASVSNILLENGGIVLGKTPNSFRDKGYAILLILIFLQLFCLLHNIICIASILILTNSESFLKRLLKSLSEEQPPRHYLASSIDVEMQIKQELWAWKDCYDFEHVHSHQDCIKGWDKLMWKEQLNDQVDIIATRFLSRDQPSPAKVLTLPVSQIHLSIQGKSITHHIASQLHFMATKEAHWKFICKQHKFVDINHEDIDWPIFKHLHKNLKFGPSKFGIKWRHNLVPLNKYKHSINNTKDSKCPSCDCP